MDMMDMMEMMERRNALSPNSPKAGILWDADSGWLCWHASATLPRSRPNPPRTFPSPISPTGRETSPAMSDTTSRRPDSRIHPLCEERLIAAAPPEDQARLLEEALGVVRAHATSMRRCIDKLQIL